MASVIRAAPLTPAPQASPLARERSPRTESRELARSAKRKQKDMTPPRIDDGLASKIDQLAEMIRLTSEKTDKRFKTMEQAIESVKNTAPPSTVSQVESRVKIRMKSTKGQVRDSGKSQPGWRFYWRSERFTMNTIYDTVF